MKKLVFGLVATLAIAATSFAGTVTYQSSGKGYKEYKKVEEPTCFSDTEFQLDIFGAYVDGNAQDHAGYIRDHGWGGGVGLNYFFARYFGLGVDGIWIYGKENAASTPHGEDDGPETTFHNVTGSFIFRYPIDSICLAPYAFIGGGYTVDGDDWASAHAGVGLEYRVVPNKIGIFTDGRWTYFGDRYGHGDLNNFLVKAGIRWVF